MPLFIHKKGVEREASEASLSASDSKSSNKHAKNGRARLFLKKEFVELQIRLYSVENMSPNASASKSDRAIVFAFSF